MTTVTSSSRHLTASAIVIDPRRRKVLLVHHRAENRLQFPGGHVDPDETPAEAAAREVREETGVLAEHTRPEYAIPGSTLHPTPVMVAERPAPAKPHKGEPAHRHIDELFLMTADSSAPLTAAPAEVDRVVWLHYELVAAEPRLRDDVNAVLKQVVLRAERHTSALKQLYEATDGADWARNSGDGTVSNEQVDDLVNAAKAVLP